jgi:hypothetical protein
MSRTTALALILLGACSSSTTTPPPEPSAQKTSSPEQAPSPAFSRATAPAPDSGTPDAPAASVTGEDKKVCFERCLKSAQMRAVGLEVIQSDCRRACGLKQGEKTGPRVLAVEKVGPQVKAEQKLPARPQLPWSRERICKRHRDCVFSYHFCSPCPACKPTWRSVTNRKTFNRERARYRRHPMKCAKCQSCPDGGSHWLGSKAVCVKGQCEVR